MSNAPPDAPAAPTYPHPITLRMLELADACPEGREEFERLFGEGPFIPIETLTARWSGRLDEHLDWVADYVMARHPEAVGEFGNSDRMDAAALLAVPCNGVEHPKRWRRQRGRVFAWMWAELGPRPDLLARLAAEQAADRAAEAALASGPGEESGSAVQVLTADMLREAGACPEGVASFVRLVGGERFTPTRAECERVMTAALDADPWADPALYYVPCHLLDAREEWREGYRDARSRYGTVCYDDSDEGTRRAAWREYQLLRARLFADLWAMYRPAVPVTEVQAVPALTADMVRRAGACPAGRQKFQTLAGGDSVVPTRAACLRAVRAVLADDQWADAGFAWLAAQVLDRDGEFRRRTADALNAYSALRFGPTEPAVEAWRAVQIDRAQVFAEMWAESGPAVSAPAEEDPLF